MSDFDAIDALLADVGPQAELPPPDVRRELREQARLSKAQVARALGVSPSTVGAWEGGRDPSDEIRAKYAYLLDGLAAKFPTEPAPEAPPAEDEDETGDESESENENEARDEAGDEVESLVAPEACVLCGAPATHRVAGFAQHLDPSDCRPETATGTQPAGTQVAGAQPTGTQPTGPAPETTPHPAQRPRSPAKRAFQEQSGPADLIGQTVQAALAEHRGDVEATLAALLKRAIPDAMRLLDETRKGARYDIVAHPWIPDILRKQTSKGADRIWEARPKWTRHELPPGRHEVTALDINGAYLSALKTHLPLGQLEHSAGFAHDRRRAGVHLITPPAWEHEAVLPNPIGNRDEPGPLWVTEPTLRLLLRLSGPKHALCEPPEIHESYTSGATENLLEKFRVALKEARDTAIADDDEVTLEYVKAMYSKFVSTMGESNYNRELYRPDWMHIIRSQAFSNLWMKALKAHDEGLTVVRAMGTDELHVIGDWHRVFPEGRGVTEVKMKDIYTAGVDAADAVDDTGDTGDMSGEEE
ncbi:helix-turn-helix domain-containing protein [Streptomyces sp. NBC_00257]|uniref:helix-turn-helix domain-containing protein n=1 Tax=unclassified Streptomyces TaxID=2593676 RepID=UPI00225BEF00|nr:MULTISPECIES: helix-turn-helix domain-containing protein [unclassified Streptomyces]WTB60836.1 helix-turn-helix domain-containing protein [Streptomyces sp. NBC_00826]WTH95977.1 helix-turn-helix domain-containing protein [Streptomyces sp. NBC_00825]WTI04999.1 helix-turn-helix domain-containing protein [Streptomyces sp. NBC_00822]MCX4870352.1 helix-turn-helix domain-containing protein [Streptomyces sp. NBC_00906]MCX4902171.1 helix-turn-helix domain-containing protein [Streptomyces sp. NBC_008